MTTVTIDVTRAAAAAAVEDIDPTTQGSDSGLHSTALEAQWPRRAGPGRPQLTTLGKCKQ